MPDKKYSFNPRVIYHWLMLIALLAIAIEFFRDVFGTGDFVGYVNAGNNAMHHADIYADYLNTWPPFFSVFSIPIALADNVNGVLTRAVWLLGLIWAMFAIIQLSVNLFFNKQLALPFKVDNPNEIQFHSPFILVPFLISFRYILDNMANIQINVFMLLMALGSVYYTVKEKPWIAGFLLALSISLKVYTVFLLPFLLVSGKWKTTLSSVFWIVLIGCIPFFYFGFDTAKAYYQTFYTERASPFAMILFKNQSIMATFRSLLMHESRGFDIYLNILNLDIKQARLLTYSIIGVAGLVVFYLFYRQGNSKKQFLLQSFLMLAAIPIISPLAWKAYFIFLFPAYLACANYVWFHFQDFKSNRILSVLLWLSAILTVLSSELFLGNYLSDITEVFSAITLGTVCLLAVLISVILKNAETP